MVTIYTDGAARGNPGPGGWGAIISCPRIVNSRQEEWVYEIGGGEKHTTNNRMELMGAIKALEFVSKLEARSYNLEAVVHTDSEYLMKGITLWIKNWQAKGWKTASKKPVLNQDLWQELLTQTASRQIQWKYVAGHSGDRANERCDIIATSFADQSPIELYDGPASAYKYL